MRQLAEDLKAVVLDWSERLAHISEGAASSRRHEGAWSNKEILGHLVDSAANNHQRFVRLQFAEYLELPGYQQEAWVRSQGYQDEPWAGLVELWRCYNLHLAHVLARLPQEALAHRCKIADYEPVSLDFIATDYVRHLRHHLAQIAP